MARLGIGLYGVSATGRPGVEPIARLTTVLLQIRELPAGEAIGYGCRGITSRPSRIAVIPIGYADGFSRRLSRGAYSVLLHGRLCPTIGNVCMDACMIDITDVPEAAGGDESYLRWRRAPHHGACRSLRHDPLRDPHDPLDAHPASLLARVSLSYPIYLKPHSTSPK